MGFEALDMFRRILSASVPITPYGQWEVAHYLILFNLVTFHRMAYAWPRKYGWFNFVILECSLNVWIVNKTVQAFLLSFSLDFGHFILKILENAKCSHVSRKRYWNIIISGKTSPVNFSNAGDASPPPPPRFRRPCPLRPHAISWLHRHNWLNTILMSKNSWTSLFGRSVGVILYGVRRGAPTGGRAPPPLRPKKQKIFRVSSVKLRALVLYSLCFKTCFAMWEDRGSL